MASPRGPRAAAARAVAGVLGQHRSLSTTLPQAIHKLDPGDRALAQEISYGVLRHLYELEGYARVLLKKPFKGKDSDLHALLLGGRMPDHAALSETVDATGELGKGWAKGVINAVLRRFQREAAELTQAPKKSLAEKNNHPDWMVQRLRNDWPEQWRTILEQNQQRPPMTLRLNLQQTTREHYLQQLQQQGITAHASANTATAITLGKGVAVALLPGFEQGMVSVQDEAPQQSATLLDPQAGERILDACAAPGGKSAHLLELQPALGELVALDSDPERLQRVEENLQRIGLQATLLCADAAASDWWDGTPFDRILVDAPCSASGVIRRNPDIKLLRRKGDIARLVATQAAILERCWGLLRPGGTLLYATCSLFADENEGQIRHFLQHHPDAEVVPIEISQGCSTGAGVQLLPGAAGMDGFYYAKLQRQGA
jgi:16S rRNA (cytosine967-C5)-methyltransferase